MIYDKKKKKIVIKGKYSIMIYNIQKIDTLKKNFFNMFFFLN